MKLLSCLVTLALLASFASAQFGGVGAKTMVAIQPDVQRELHLSKDQKKRLTEAMNNLGSQYKGGSPDQMNSMPSFDMDSMNEKLDADALSDLDEQQKQRLFELWLQYEGPGVLVKKEASDPVGLTAAEVKKIQALCDKADSDRMAAMMDMAQHPNSGRGLKGKLNKMVKDRDEAILALLTPDELKKWQALEGKPFKFKQPKLM